jgi:DNA-directed RNA polymerase specialized sigma24 family protein
VSREETEFAEFFQASWEPCLMAVVASTGSVQLAEDQVAEAFARAWLSWRKVRRHPAPRAWVVRTALNAGASWWRRRRRLLSCPDRQDPNDREISFTLIVAGAPLSCTSIPDHGPHPDDGPSGQS